MSRWGDAEIVRVFAKHEPYQTGHLGIVVNEMREMGPPTIRVVEWRGDLFAIEGSHRLAAAHHLGMTPNLIVEYPDMTDQAGENFWDAAKTGLPYYSWLVDTPSIVR